jgi:formate/nitrite transporter FocA (FNT family)
MKNILTKSFASLAYLAMAAVNFLANGLPINNRSTGEISDAYPNLFAPAGPAFAIWGLIYILLAGYVQYHEKKRFKRGEGVAKYELCRN